MFWRAKDGSDAAKSFVLSPQLMLENDAGWKMKVVPELTVSYRFGSRLLTPRPLGTSSLKAIFRSAEGSGCSVSSRTEALWSFIVRATVRLGEERSDNCVPNVPKVRCRRDETSGSVSHLLFHLMNMCVCVCVFCKCDWVYNADRIFSWLEQCDLLLQHKGQ